MITIKCALQHALLGALILLTPSAVVGETIVHSQTALKAEKDARVQLAVEITGLRNDKGNVAVALFNDDDSFPDQERALQGQVVVPKGKRARVVFKGLRPGVYALAVLHDENRNNKMDFNLLGMPQEGYGFSNNASAMFGPPSFQAASLRVLKSKSLTRIKMRYFSL